MSSRFLILITLLACTATSCEGQANSSAMITSEASRQTDEVVRFKDRTVDSITMRYRNIETYKKLLGDRDRSSLTYEELLQQYENYTIEKKDWGLILAVLTTAIYDKAQYDKVKNPHGFMIRVKEQDYSLTIHYANGEQDGVAVWKGSSRINLTGKWYAITEKSMEFHSMLECYTTSREWPSPQVELTSWQLDDILLYDTPNGTTIGKLVLERYYPKKKFLSKQKTYFLNYTKGRVAYLVRLRGEGVDFKPYVLVDGEASQIFKREDDTAYGGTTTITGGYELRMRLVGGLGEWAKVVIHEPTGKTAYIKVSPDFRKYKPVFEQ